MITIRSLLIGLCLTWGACAAVGDAGEDARLEQYFREYLERSFQLRPMEATRLGDHRFDHLMDDLSPAARRRWTAHLEETLRQLPKRVDYSKLSRAAQVDFEILRHEMKTALWVERNTKPFEEDPRIYNDYLSDSIFLPLAQSSLPAEMNVSNAIARMRLLPQITRAARENLTRPPRVHTETAVRQNRGAIAFYEKEIFQVVGKTAQEAALKEAAAGAAAELRKYQEFLERELLPKADGDWRLGAKRFAAKLDLTLNSGLKAAEVLAEAEAEFTRVRDQMYVIARQLWATHYPKLPLPADDVTGRRETIAKVLAAVAQDHSRPEDLVREARETVVALKKFITDKDILRLPEPDQCAIIEMPEFQRGNSTAYMNSPPALDPKAAGYYAISPPPQDWTPAQKKSFLEEYNRQMLHILTIHEAFPGHYIQYEYANRHASLLRKVLGSGVYVEGWAVYTEQTMLDQGYGEGNLALRLTQLKFFLRAVANAILDHRMHCKNMTDEQAMTLLCDEAFQSEGEARLKVIRSKQSSCQLSTYYVGRLAHYRLRQAIQREMGEQFQLGRYHEAVLSAGPVPVKYLPELVRTRLNVSNPR